MAFSGRQRSRSSTKTTSRPVLLDIRLYTGVAKLLLELFKRADLLDVEFWCARAGWHLPHRLVSPPAPRF